MKAANVSCIIPYFNEGQNILSVIQVVSQVENINQIICVDDGSTDNYANHIKKKFPNITLITLPKNRGKTYAIDQGLRHAKNNIIMLLDADIKGVKKEDILNALSLVIKGRDIDMIILRRVNDLIFFKIFRWDTILSGERILKKDFLQKVLQQNIRGYQLEVALNEYAKNNKKQVYWMPIRGTHPSKFEKWGFSPNVLFLECRGLLDQILYPGIGNFIGQTLFFCRKELKESLALAKA